MDHLSPDDAQELAALRHLVEAAEEGLAFYDLDLRLVASNEGWRREFGQAEPRGRPLRELLSPGTFAVVEGRLHRCRGGEAQTYVEQGPSPGREVQVRLLPARDRDGRVAGLLELRREVEGPSLVEGRLAAKEAELAAREAELRRLATTDSLSGALNRAAILGYLAEEVRRASRYARPLSLVLFDFDHFKLVNDIHGQEAGDEAIRRFASLCGTTFRTTDLVGRYGGEEFLAVLPEVDGPGALLAAERVRESFQEERFRARAAEDEFTVTVSAGIAGYQRGFDVDRMLAAADTALYRAKERGRNRIEVHGKR